MTSPTFYTVHPHVGARQFNAARAAESLMGDAATPVLSAPDVQSFDTGMWHGPLCSPLGQLSAWAESVCGPSERDTGVLADWACEVVDDER